MAKHELKTLLSPCKGSNPSGSLLRYTETYDLIQDARSSTDPSDLPEGVWALDEKKSDWLQVEQLCTDALANKTKDLQIAAWLTEAWMSMKGLEGLSEGLFLVDALSKNFWPTLYPMDSQDEEFRLAPYEWLDKQMATNLLKLPVIFPKNSLGLPYFFGDWIDAQHFDLLSQKQKDPKQFLESLKKPTLQQVMSSVQQTPASFYEALEFQIQNVKNGLKQIEETTRQKAGKECVVFYDLPRQLNQLSRQVSVWKKMVQNPLSPSSKTTALEDPDFLEKDDAPTESLRTRQDAYRLLRNITDFLQNHDPHSPTPYVLRQILSWEDKSLPDIYSRWADDPSGLSFFVQFLKQKS